MIKLINLLLIVLLLMVCGWYFVWHLFLSKFKFLRELVGDTGSQEGDNEQPSGSETEEDPSASPQKIRSARQRRPPVDAGH